MCSLFVFFVLAESNYGLLIMRENGFQSSQNAKEIIEYRKKSPNGATHNYMESHSALFISNVP